MRKCIELDLLYVFFQIRANFGILWFMEKLRKLKKGKRQRKHGFLVRRKTAGGRRVLKKRMQKQKNRLTI